MQLHFIGKNLDVTPALKTFTQEKFEKIEHRANNISNINITFEVENVTHIAEATFNLNGASIHAAAKSADMYAAVDELVDKLIGQITKHKEKHSDHR